LLTARSGFEKPISSGELTVIELIIIGSSVQRILEVSNFENLPSIAGGLPMIIIETRKHEIPKSIETRRNEKYKEVQKHKGTKKDDPLRAYNIKYVLCVRCEEMST